MPTGIGGVFFKSQDPATLREWYRSQMPVDIQPWGGAQFFFNHRDRPGVGYTVWNPFEANIKYFEPSEKTFTINLRVDDLEAMLTELRAS